MLETKDPVEAMERLAGMDENLARHMLWRDYGYKLEVQARLEENFGIEVSRRKITEHMRSVSEEHLGECGEFGLDEMKSAIRKEFKR